MQFDKCDPQHDDYDGSLLQYDGVGITGVELHCRNVAGSTQTFDFNMNHGSNKKRGKYSIHTHYHYTSSTVQYSKVQYSTITINSFDTNKGDSN